MAPYSSPRAYTSDCRRLHLGNRDVVFPAAHQQDQFNGFCTVSLTVLEAMQGSPAKLFTEDEETEDMGLDKNVELVQPGDHHYKDQPR